MNKETPSYYAIIPADVRYSNIPGDAKLLYGEITALSNKEGYCWASNSYFAELYGVDLSTIKRWLVELIKNDFIRSENSKEEGNKRKIFLTNPRLKNEPRSAQKEAKLGSKMSRPSISNNNKITTTPISEVEFISLVDPYAQKLIQKGASEEMVKNEISRFISYWTEKNPKNGRMRYQDQKYFEVNRRLATWFGNKITWQKDNIKETKGIRI